MSDLHHRVEETQAILARIAREYSPAACLRPASAARGHGPHRPDFESPRCRSRLFSLETGRLHAETLDMLAEARSARPTDTRSPCTKSRSLQAVEAYVASELNGLNAFYDSVEPCARNAAAVRKVEPLGRALGRQAAPGSPGLRRSNSPRRVPNWLSSESTFDADYRPAPNSIHLTRLDFEENV